MAPPRSQSMPKQQPSSRTKYESRCSDAVANTKINACNDNTDLYYQILSKKAEQQNSSGNRASITESARKKERDKSSRTGTRNSRNGQKRRENGYKYVFDLVKERWVTFEVSLDIEEQPFQQGTMRWCFRAFEYDRQGERFPSVVKVYKDPRDGPRAYFSEAITQMIAESYAQKFNAASPVSKVAILPIAVCRFKNPLFGSHFATVEPYLPGNYIKHSDNVGTVATSDPVPQALSHFTYEASNHLLVVCDIQGVSNFYTDPQIHSIDGKGFGLGNLGLQGINRFLHTHVCNSVCRQLKLPTIIGRAASSSKLSSSTNGYMMQPPHQLPLPLQQSSALPGGQRRSHSSAYELSQQMHPQRPHGAYSSYDGSHSGLPFAGNGFQGGGSEFGAGGRRASDSNSQFNSAVLRGGSYRM